ncbi:hypothetical protein KAE78_07625 [Microbacterium sp. NIBRBAC000506063]|nr:hypothetical protein KAE78_07625 [Microbacterium sp. NIBRBAC000506063]
MLDVLRFIGRVLGLLAVVRALALFVVRGGLLVRLLDRAVGPDDEGGVVDDIGCRRLCIGVSLSVDVGLCSAVDVLVGGLGWSSAPQGSGASGSSVCAGSSSALGEYSPDAASGSDAATSPDSSASSWGSTGSEACSVISAT